MAEATPKGLSGPVRAWCALGEGAVESRFAALRTADLRSPPIGREEELEFLLRRWRRAASGEGQVVLISGEAGIGKSRLLIALQEALAADDHEEMVWYCSHQHTDSALHPIIARLERAAGFAPGDGPELRAAKLGALLAAGDPRQEEADLIADLLGIPTQGRCVDPGLSPQQRRERTLAALLRRMEALSARRPVLALLEDAHWVDPTTIELLDLVVRRVAELPVLLVVTHRPEFRAPWAGPAHVAELHLGRLGRRDNVALLERTAGGKALPPEVAEHIVRRADGVPLFVEELTKAVIEGGGLREEADRYVLVASLPMLAVPATLQASLTARLDRLGEARDVAQITAALGREFPHALIAAVADRPEPALDRSLGRLVEAGLLFRRGAPPDAVYSFRHALLQDAAYSSLLRAQRQKLHRRVAQALDERFPRVAEAEPEVLARHYTEAGLLDQAVGRWEVAGHRALARSAQAEAAAHLREAARLVRALPSSEQRDARELALLLQLGQALFGASGGGAPATGAAFVQAKELARSLGDQDAFFRAVYGLFVVYAVAGQYREGVTLGREARAFAEEIGSATGQAVAERVLGTSHYHLGELLEAERHLRRATEMRRLDTSGGDYGTRFAHHPLITAPATLALVVWALGHPAQSEALAHEATAAEGGADANTAAYVMTMTTLCHLLRQCPEAAAEHASELTSFSEQRGARYLANLGEWMQGAALVQMGRAEDGLKGLRSGWRRFLDAGGRQFEPLVHCFEAQAHLTLGRLGEAVGCLDAALRAVEETMQRFYEPDAHRLRAEVQLRAGDCAAAEASFLKAIAVSRAQSARSWELRAATGLARLCREQHRIVEGCGILAPVYGSFTEGFELPDLAEARTLLQDLDPTDPVYRSSNPPTAHAIAR